MMIASTTRPVFIVGCPRSGTTWLYHLLLSSGSFAIYRSETQFYNQFGPAFRGFRSENQRKSFLDQWQQSEFFLRSGLDADSFRESAGKYSDSPGGFLRALMVGICEQQGATRWAECTPAHGLYAQQIKRDFPDALFIHIIRDGRDVALSLARQRFIGTLPWHSGKPEIAAAAYWSWITRQISENTEFLGKDLLNLRYIDLVDNFESTMSCIAEFIDKPIDVNRIVGSPIGAVGRPNSSFTDEASPDSLAHSPRWQSSYDQPLMRMIEQVMRPELERFGYPLSDGNRSSRPSIAASVNRWTYACRFQMGLTLKNLGLSPSRGSAIAGPTTPATDSDPTLRPAQNLQLIRDLVQQ